MTADDTARGPWLSEEGRRRFEREERRRLFEVVMWDVDSGDLDLATALAVLRLDDAVLEPTYDDGQPALFDLDDRDGAT